NGLMSPSHGCCPSVKSSVTVPLHCFSVSPSERITGGVDVPVSSQIMEAKCGPKNVLIDPAKSWSFNVKRTGIGAKLVNSDQMGNVTPTWRCPATIGSLAGHHPCASKVGQ